MAAPGVPLPELVSCRTIGVAGDEVAADDLAATLREAGLAIEAADPTEAEVVVLCHGLGAEPVARAFSELTRLAGRRVRPRVLVAVAADTIEGVSVFGLVKTAAREWDAAWKCVTVAPGPAGRGIDIRQLAFELARGGADREVRVGGHRAVCVRVPEPVDRTARTLISGVWVISGGGRGVTAACAVALAGAGARRIALLGRTAIVAEPAGCAEAADQAALQRVLVASAEGAPNLAAIGRQARAILAARDIRATMAAIEAAGADVRYITADVTDAAAVQEAIAGVRRTWGPIRGVVHAAGVLADKRLGEKTAAQFDSVWRTKVDGARALLAGCAEDPLEQICLFSSVAAHAGNPGQSDYAAANAALERLAVDEQVRRGARCRVVSIAWGPWDGGMVTDALAKHFAAQGVGLIPLTDGARAFVDELRSGAGVHVIVGHEPTAAGEVEPRRYRFDLATLPMLSDHRVADAVVLPMVMALDTLLAEGRRVFGRSCEAHDVRVLGGVIVAGDGAELDLRREQAPAGGQRLTLLHVSGRPAYRADVAPCNGSVAPGDITLPAAGARVPDACRAPYAAALFHGPAFHVIREVLQCTETTIAARLATAGAMGWPDGWQIDPAALDGALQLLRLWGFTRDGRTSLPTSIGRCRPWTAWPATGDVVCTVTCRREGEHAIAGDALFVASDTGAALLSLERIVMHIHA